MTTANQKAAATAGRRGLAARLRQAGLIASLGVAAVLAGSYAPTTAQSGGGGGGGPTPAVRIGTASLMSPAAANAYFQAQPNPTVSTNSVQVSGQPLINAPHAEYVELARALENDPDLIYEFVRNTVDTTFTYGVSKGGLGALIDRKGTAFDQAQLMVGLLRAAGHTASYRAGTITLNASQFSAWTGISNASAACQLLAGGGIPATINGSTTANCSYGSANVSSVVMGHVWVAAVINGTTYFFDPAYKPYDVVAGVNLASVAGLSSGQALTQASSGAQTGTASGVAYVRAMNGGNLDTRIQAHADALQTYIDTNLSDGRLEDLVGGREIVRHETPAGGLRQTALPYPATVTQTWTGNIPNPYRASLRIRIKKWSTTGTQSQIIGRLVYADDVYGRRLVFQTNFDNNRNLAPNATFLGELRLVNEHGEGPTLASHTASESPAWSTGDITLDVNMPYAARAAGSTADGSYMDAEVVKSVTYSLPMTIVNGWGEATGALVAKWGTRSDSGMPVPRADGCETCMNLLPQTAGDGRREQMAVSWLAQSGRAGALHAQIAGSVYQHHYSVGVVSADSVVTSKTYEFPTYVRFAHSIADSFDRVDIDTGFSLVSRTNVTANRRAAIHAIAATLNALEGAVAGQAADLPDVNATATRFQWGNAPPSGEDQASGVGSRRFYAFTSANAANASTLVKVEGVTANAESGQHGAHGEPPIGNSEIQMRRSALASAISNYAAAGFSVFASEDAFLGPGQRAGNFEGQYHEGQAFPLYYTHHFSNQRGGALVANRYDANGDPVEIAHVVVSHRGAIKGGGGGAQTWHDAQYAPPEAADFIRDEFIDRSSAAGVDLSSGSVSYTSPAALTVGQGDFPHSLSASVTWRGGNWQPDFSGLGSQTNPSGPWTTSWNNELTISSSTLEVLGEGDIRAAAGTVAAFLVMQDVYKGAATTQREVAGALTAAWWLDHVTGNVVSATLGTNTQQFLRRADGEWFSPGATYARLTQTGARTRIAQQPSCSTSEVTYVPTRGWSYAGMSFQVTSATGDVQTFENWQADVTPMGSGESCLRARGFRLASWEYPGGVDLTVSYAMQGMNAPGLAEVNSNLGLKIVFLDHGRGGFHNGLSGGNRREVALTSAQHADAGGNITRFTTEYLGTGLYRRHLLTEIFEPRSATEAALRYTYDSVGRVMEARDAVAIATPASRNPHQFFIADGYRAARLNPLGHRYTVEYDLNGRPFRHTDELGRQALASFDGRGRVISRTSAWGDVTTFAYDDRNNLTQRTQTPRAGCGTDAWWCQTITVSAQYHATWNRPTRITLPATAADPSMRHWDFTYNANGLLTQVKGPSVLNGLTGTNAQPIWATTYDAYGRVATQTDPTGRRASNTYGGGGLPAFCQRLATVSSQSGGLNLTTTFACNAVGDVTSVTDPLGNTTTTTYDNLRRPTAEVGPAGTNIETRWTYDANGNQTHERRWDAAASVWRVTQTVYSLTNQPGRVIDPEGRWTRYCYDQLDRAYRVIDPSLRMRIHYWNAAGQPTETRRFYTAPHGSTCSANDGRPTGVTSYRERAFEYNEGGLLSAEIDANGNRTEFQYDGLGRQLVTEYADGTEAWTLMDQRGQTVIRKQRSGLRAQVFYDAAGRDYHVWEHQNGAANMVGRHIRAAYDLAGRPVWRDVSVQPTSTWSDAHLREVRTYGYDAAGRLTTDQVRPEGNGGSNPLTLVFTYGYDAAGNRTSIQWPDAWTATYAYDAANRPTTVGFGGHTATHVWDSMSRRTALNRSNNANTTWTYSAASRATTMVHGFTSGSPTPTATFSYGYDDSGKITSLNANQAVFEWAPSLNYARTYGAVNNRNQVASEIQGGTTRANNFDLDGNMTSDGVNTYTWTFGNRLAGASRSGMTASYAYDGDDRRTVKVVNGVMTRTLWSGADELAETNQAGTILRRFVPSGTGAMDDRLAMLSGTTISWFHTDHLGSVIAVSAANGRTTATAAYSLHGELASGVIPPGGVFGYTGRQFDPETGLYQYRARYYHPRLGQFLSTDPIGTQDDPNLYQYVGWDPVNATDPTGRCWWCGPAVIGGIAGGGVGAGVEYWKQRQAGGPIDWRRVRRKGADGAISGVIAGVTGTWITRGLTLAYGTVAANTIGGATGGGVGGVTNTCLDGCSSGEAAVGGIAGAVSGGLVSGSVSAITHVPGIAAAGPSTGIAVSSRPNAVAAPAGQLAVQAVTAAHEASLNEAVDELPTATWTGTASDGSGEYVCVGIPAVNTAVGNPSCSKM